MINNGAINNNATISELTDLENYVNTTKSNLQTSINGKLSATQSKSSNGWVKFSNGIIIQWGHAGSGASVSVTLPTAFTSTNYSVSAVPTAAKEQYDRSVTNKTKTSFTIIGNGTGAAQTNSDWIAIGY